jgi:hypothetical protein
MSSCSRDDSQGSESAETAEKRDTVRVGVAAADRSAKLTNDLFL